MHRLPSAPILTAAEMRAAEEAVISRGVSAADLMERAGRGIAEAVWRFGRGQPTLFLCGPGNNGGDGYVAARMLQERGTNVRVAAMREPKSPAALAARRTWHGPVETLDEAELAPVVVDCLFGTGMARPLEPEIATALDRHFHADAFRIAADIPSGIGTDDGAMLGYEQVRYPAHLTLALGALKPAHVLQPGSDFCGHIICLDIGVPVASTAMVSPFAKLPVAPTANIHKFDRAVAVVAGAMPGASQLAVSAASRLAGYAVLATESDRPNPVSSIVQRSFEDIIIDPRFKTWIIGPGLGRGGLASAQLQQLIESDHRLIIDADALTLLGEMGVGCLKGRSAPTILTPHEGEFRKLFGDLAGSKIERARAACELSGATIICKGSDTLVVSPGEPPIVRMVQPAPTWLATAGTGDVLAGLAGAFLSFVDQTEWAALAAVELHGAIARRVGPGLIADDMPGQIGAVLKANSYD